MKSPAWSNVEKTQKFCTRCGAPKSLTMFPTTGKKVDGSPKYNSWCKSCISLKQASYHKQTWGEDKLQFVAFKRTQSVRSYLSYLRSKATQRNKNGEVISLDALELLWQMQGGTCALTGWPLTMELTKGVVQTNCSIDRINSDIGYVVGNVQLVCRIANVAKTNLTTADFVALCRAVIENANG
jgi:hypothetical protein